MNGICTLSNDFVYDQLVALLNSIEVRLGSDTPVCIYPFDDQLKKVKAEVEKRPNVFIYDDVESIQRWDDFMLKIAPERLNKKVRLYGAHRRFCAFDGPFEQFVYMDADTLLMNSLDCMFEKLNDYDWVVYDFQTSDPSKIYNLNSSKLQNVFDQYRINSEIFCSGFYGSKRGLFNAESRERFISLLNQGEVEILYEGAGEQPVLNYMVMRSGIASYNFAQQLPQAEKAGCCVVSSHFTEKDHILYDKGNRLTYVHYIGIAPQVMQAVCQGQNIEFPYRDLFLHYRYLHQPEKKPIFTTPGVPYNAIPQPNLFKRILKKLKVVNG
ncbi:MAG: Npun_R2821/Npun_R2822 family protein [Microcoleaceae cyanobacterium]